MKRNIISLDEIKKRINDLKGNSVNMEINKGRNRIDKFTAVIIKVYPSVFTVEACPQNQQTNQKELEQQIQLTSIKDAKNQKLKKQNLNRGYLNRKSQNHSKTFSYFDVLCGDVKITPVLEAKI